MALSGTSIEDPDVNKSLTALGAQHLDRRYMSIRLVGSPLIECNFHPTSLSEGGKSSIRVGR